MSNIDMSINVIKRDQSQEPLNYDKIHKILEIASEGVENISISDIEMNSRLSFFDGITSVEIHDKLVRSASNLISEETPEYDKVAANLLLISLHKDVWGEGVPPRLYEHIKYCVDKGIYDDDVLKKYSKSEIHKINKFVEHSRDEKFTYSGLQQNVG